MSRFIGFVLGFFLMGAVGVGTGLYFAGVPTERPVFKVGERIGVVWQCFPKSMFPPGFPYCYTEVLQVTKVRDDGFVEVLDEVGMPWIINPAQAMSFQHEPEQLLLPHREIPQEPREEPRVDLGAWSTTPLRSSYTV